MYFFKSIHNIFHFRPFNFSALKLSPLLSLILQLISIVLEYSKSLFLTFILKIMFSLLLYFYSIAVVQAAAMVQVFIYSHLSNSFDSYLKRYPLFQLILFQLQITLLERLHWLTVACQVTSAAPSSSLVKPYLGILELLRLFVLMHPTSPAFLFVPGLFPFPLASLISPPSKAVEILSVLQS